VAPRPPPKTRVEADGTIVEVVAVKSKQQRFKDLEKKKKKLKALKGSKAAKPGAAAPKKK
jgi:hypothetical protein